MLHVASCQLDLVYWSGDLYKPLQQLNGLNKVNIPQDKVTQSVQTLGVVDSKTSCFWSTFLNC